MNEPTVATSRNRFQFSIKYLLVMLTLMSVMTASCVYLATPPMFGPPPGPYKSFDEWPRVLKDLVEAHPECEDEVTPYRITDGFDQCSVWRIKPNSKLRGLLDERNQLLATDHRHVKARELIEKIPRKWPKPDFPNCDWLVSPGYGMKHIEFVDLFIIADDPATGESFLMHEWIF